MEGRIRKVAWVGLWSLVFTFGFLVAPVGAQRGGTNPGWSEPAPLNPGFQASTGTDRALNTKIVLTQRDVFVVWAQQVSGGQAADIFLAHSENDGKNFTFFDLSNTPSIDSGFPDLWVEREDVYVVWEEGSGQDKEVFLRISRDGGESFGTAVNISNAANREDRNPRIAVSSRIILIVWEQVGTQSNESDIFFVFSRDSGQTFQSPRNLSATSGTLSTLPQLARGSSGTFFVAWEDELQAGSTANTEIFFASLTLTQEREAVGQRINVSNTADRHSLNPTLVATQRQIFLAWEEGAQSANRTDRQRCLGDTGTSTSEEREIFIAVSSDEGESFPTASRKNVSNTPEFDSRCPALLVSGFRTLFLAWEEEEGQIRQTGTSTTETTTGKTDIWVTRSEDNGVTFFPAQNLSNSFGLNSRRAQMAGTRRDVFLVWEEEVTGTSGGGEILFARSDDSGQNFFVAQNLSRSLGDASRRPQVGSDGQTVLVLWEETPRLTGSSQGNQLFITRNEDSGKPFSTRRLSRSIVTQDVVSPPSSSSGAEEATLEEAPATSLEIQSANTQEAWSFHVRATGQAVQLRLEIYDLAGRAVFAQETSVSSQAPGTLRWPLVNHDGRSVANGIYLYVIRTKDGDGKIIQTEVNKLVVKR